MQRTTLSSSSTDEMTMTGRWRGRVGGLDPAERLVAVHLRHLEVEQDDVDARRAFGLEQVHRHPAVLGLDDLVALGLEGAREDGPVEPRVVDDEDAAVLVAHAASPAVTAPRRAASTST